MTTKYNINEKKIADGQMKYVIKLVEMAKEKGKAEILGDWYRWLNQYYGICQYKSNFKDDEIEEKIKELKQKIEEKSK